MMNWHNSSGTSHITSYTSCLISSGTSVVSVKDTARPPEENAGQTWRKECGDCTKTRTGTTKKTAVSRRSGRTAADIGRRRHYWEKESAILSIMAAVPIPPRSHNTYAIANFPVHRNAKSRAGLTRRHYAKYINHKTTFVKTRPSKSPFLRTGTDS